MKFLDLKISKRIKRLTVIGITSSVLISSICISDIYGVSSFLSESFLASQQELNQTNQQIESLKEEQAAVKNELEDKMEELTNLLADKEILEKDMELTQAAIAQAEIDLEAAKDKEMASYEAMKLRIQYMYENSKQTSVIGAVLNADGITDLVNRVEYVTQVHKTDRELLEAYKDKVEEVELLASSLEANMNELLTMQEIYEHQEKEIESAVAVLKKKAKNYDSKIASAKRKAQKLADEIREANEAIANGTASGSSGSSGSSLTGSSNPSYTTGVSGEAVVSFALQYVGYPYKYGGYSLTNGCDCSGFVKLVFANFGITTPRQSQEFKRVGQAVSFENMRAGDIVVYPGHVAIYIGNGKIVEAQSSRAGITCNRSVTCSTITAIRRIL